MNPQHNHYDINEFYSSCRACVDDLPSNKNRISKVPVSYRHPDKDILKIQLESFLIQFAREERKINDEIYIAKFEQLLDKYSNHLLGIMDGTKGF